MRNLFLFACVAFLMAGCISNEYRKMEIDQEITQLEKRIANRTDQLIQIKERRKNRIEKFRMSVQGNLSNTELSSRQNEYQKQAKSLEIRENQCEINNLKDKLEIEKLKQESAML